MRYIDNSAATSEEVGGILTIPRRGIVLHTTMGYNSLDWLQGGSARAGSPASADYLVDRNGTIHQITQLGRFAYHSGKARHNVYQERDGSISRGYIGIEFEAAEQNGQYMTTLQYIAGAALVKRLVGHHNLPLVNITTHQIVALPRGRKSDPMKLDWAVFTNEMFAPSHQAASLVFPARMP